LAWFDYWTCSAFNSLVHRSWTFDTLCVLIASNFLFKGAWVCALYPWAWFRADGKPDSQRTTLMYGMVGALASVPVARLIGFLFPFRLRPIHDPRLHLQLAYGLDPATLLSWTSFPSDHATLFTALAVTLILVAPRVGAVALGYVLLFIDLPRIYLGIHYPTDILAGTLIGTGIALLARIDPVREGIGGWGVRLWQRNEAVFFAVFSLLLYLLGIAFEPVPQVLRFLAEVAKAMAQRVLGG
jgi:undecaprenyl-diphosphatase